MANPNPDDIQKAAVEYHIAPGEIKQAFKISLEQVLKKNKDHPPKVAVDHDTIDLAAKLGLTGSLESKENQWRLFVYAAELATWQEIKIDIEANNRVIAADPDRTTNSPALRTAEYTTTSYLNASVHTSTATAYIPSPAIMLLNEASEGYVAKAVQQKIDRAGVISVGFGHTNLADPSLKEGEIYTREQAVQTLYNDLKMSAKYVQAFWNKNLNPGELKFLDLPQNIQDTLATYAFGAGAAAAARGEWAKLFKQGKFEEGAEAFLHGAHTANGKVLAGLDKKNRWLKEFAEGNENPEKSTMLITATTRPNPNVEWKTGGNTLAAGRQLPGATQPPIDNVHAGVLAAAKPAHTPPAGATPA